MPISAAQNTEVLLVEDNPHDAELTLIALKKKGIDENVFLVRDGAEALDFLMGKGAYTGVRSMTPLKLVLLDLKLPKLNGFEVLEEIRKHAEFSTMPVVIHSSSAVEADIQRAYDLGANSYIVKPINFHEHSVALSESVYYWKTHNQTLI